MKNGILILSICVIFTAEIFACTGIYLFKNGRAFFGSNEDYNLEYTAYFVPAGPAKYGAVFFSWSEYYMQGGINEVGLCYDGFATGHKTIVDTDGKIIPGRGNGYTDPMQYIIRNYESVPEALEEIKNWDLRSIGLENAQLMLADRFGNSVTIEGDSIIYVENGFQVTTNFYRSDHPDGNYPCRRYNRASGMLERADTVNAELFKDVLSAVHQEGEFFTVYSYFADLASGDVYIYNKYNYEELYVFDLKEELAAGYREIPISSFFSNLNLSLPLNNTFVDSNSVNFIWTGESASYDLYISEFENFEEQLVVEIPEHGSSTSVSADWQFLFLAIFFFPLAFRKIKITKWSLIILLTLLIGCSESGSGGNVIEPIEEEEDNNYSILISSNEINVSYYTLEKGKKYYWKVECEGSAGNKTVSEIRSFTVQ